MKISKAEALQLISALATKIDQTRSIKDQLSHHFMPTLWGDGVVLKDSFKGRIFSLLSPFESAHARTQRIQTVFSHALKSIEQKDLNEFDLSFRVKLFNEFHSATGPSESALPPPKEIQRLKADAQAKAQTLQERIHRDSLLRSSNQIIPTTKEQLEALFGWNAEFSAFHLQAYFKANPQFAHQDCTDKLKALERGYEFRRMIEKFFFDKDLSLSKQERQTKTLKFATAFSEEVQNLSAGKRLFFMGRFGQKIRSVDALFELLKKIPKPLLENLPSALQEQLQKETPPDPNLFVEESVANIMAQFKNFIPDMDLGFLGPLLQDDKRALPTGISKAMPHALRDPLERWLKEGLLSGLTNVADLAPPSGVLQVLSIISQNADLVGGNLSGLHLGLIGDLLGIASSIPKNELQSILAWVSKHANQFKNAETKDELIRELSQKIASFTQQPVDELKQYLNRAIDVGFGHIQHLFSNDFFKLFDFYSFFDSGEFWIEFIKQEDGNYTLLIYGSEGALSHHPDDDKTKQKIWPLEIKNIDSEKIDSQFFQRLLYHTIEPQLDNSTVSRGEDLYEGVLNYLEKTPEKSETDYIDPEMPTIKKQIESKIETHHIDNSVKTALHIAQVALSSPSTSPGFIRFQMQVEGFIAYCHPYLTGPDNTLVIPNLTVADDLNQFMSLLLVEGNKLKDLKTPNFDGNQFYDRLMLTEKEINQAISNLKIELESKKVPQPNPLNLPQEALGPLREFTIQLGVSSQDIDAAIGPLTWALGDEIGEILHKLKETVGPLPQVRSLNNAQLLPRKSQGWLRDIFCNIYYCMALEALKVAITCARVYQSGFSPLLVMPLLHQGLKTVLPTPIYGWYEQVLQRITAFVLQLLLKLVFHLLLSKDQQQQILVLQKTWQNSLQSFSDKVMGNRRVFYDLNPGTSQEKPEVPLKVTHRTTHSFLLTTPQRDSGISSYSIGVKFENKPRPTLADLNTWVQTAEGMQQKGDEQLMFLLHHLEQLQIPTRSGGALGNLWLDEIQNTEEYLNKLTDLSIYLLNNSSAHTSDSQIYGRVVVSMYSILAIVDYSARRCPKAKLDGYEINAYKLLEWMKLPTAELVESSSVAQLHKICAYFFPDIDINNLPSSAEIAIRAKQTLFDYSSLQNWVNRPGKSYSGLTFNLFHHLPEIRYLSGRAEDPEINKEIIETNFNESYLQYLLDHSSKHLVLFYRIFNHFWKRGSAVDNELDRPYQKYCRELGKKISRDIKEGKFSAEYHQLLIAVISYNKMANCTSWHSLYSKGKPSRETFEKIAHEIDSNSNWRKYLKQEDLAKFLDDPASLSEIISLQKILWKAGFCQFPFDEKVPDSFANLISQFFYYPEDDPGVKTVKYFNQLFFFISVLKNPNISQEFPVLHRAIQNSFFKEGSPQRDKLHVLHEDSLTFQSHNHILAPSFKYLKLQTLLNNHLINQGVNFQPVDKIKGRMRLKGFRPEHFWYDLNDVAFQEWCAVFPLALRESLVSTTNETTFLAPLQEKAGFFQSNGPRTQSDIMAKTDSQLAKLTDSPSRAQHLEMVQTEQPDQIIRLVAYLNEHKDDLEGYGISMFARKILFHATDLNSQLKASPQIALTLGKFFNDLTIYYSKNKKYSTLFWLIEVGIKLKSSCGDLSIHFPNFTEILQNLSKEHSLAESARSRLAILIALSLDKVPSTATDEEKQQVFHALSDVKLSYHGSYALEKLLFEVKEMAWKWNEVLSDHTDKRPAINLFNPNLADELSKKLTSLIGERGKEFDFTNENEVLLSSKGDLEVSRQINAIPMDLTRDDGGLLLRESLLPNRPPKFSLNLKIVKISKNKRYLLIQPFTITKGDSCGMLSIFPPLDLDSHCLWLEETANEIKELVIEDKQEKLIVKILVSGTRNLSFVGVEFDGKILTPISSTKASHALSAVTRFCPLEELECWTDSAHKQLTRFTFIPYKLSFNVETINGHPCGVDSEGYAIAHNQSHPSLKGVVSYLLLEKGSQKRVIIRDGQWMSSLANRFLVNLGPLTNLAGNMLLPLNQADKKACFTYDIDSKGELLSEDPEALAYLITLYLLQGNTALAIKACSVLEAICKQRSIEEKVVDLLLPLALVPFQFQSIPHIRQRLLAAVEESLMKPQVVPQEDNSQSNILREALFSIVTLYDLYQIQENPSLYKLSDAQEWFLYKSLFRRSQKFLACEGILPSSTWKMIENMDWETFVECVILPPSLAKRYGELKRKSNLGNSLIKQGITLCKELLFAPSVTSVIPGMPSLSSPLTFSSPTFVTDLVRAGKAVSKNRLNLKSLNYEKLKNLMGSKVKRNPPLHLQNLNASTFKYHFLTYYALAIGDYRPDKTFFHPDIFNPRRFDQRYFDPLSDCFKSSKAPRKEFNSLLPLLKGGWDSETAILVEFLEAVKAGPLLFPSVEKLKEALNDNSTQNLQSFFESVNNRVLAKKVVGEAIPKLLGFAAGMVVNSQISSAVLLPFATTSFATKTLGKGLLPAIHWGSKAAHVTYTNAKKALTVAPIKQASLPAQTSALNYAVIDEDDTRINAKLDELHCLAFSSVVQRDQVEQRFEVLPGEEDKVTSLANKHINQNILDYYARPDRTIQYVRLKSEEGLWDLYMGLSTYKSMLQKQLKGEEQALLEIINPPHLSLTEKFSLEDLKHDLLKGDFSPLFKEIQLSPELMPQMELGIVRYFAREVRLQQINRALAIFDQLAFIDSKAHPKLYEEKLEQLSDELKTRRAYRYEGLNLRLMRRLVLFEATTNKMVWKKQYDIIANLLLSGKKDVVIELLMGLGKTSFGIPLIDAFEANGKQIVFNIFLSAIAATNIRDLSKNGKEIFGQTSNVLRFERGMPLTPQKLDALQIILRRALENGEVVHITKEDGLAQQLILIDKLHQYVHGQNQATSSNREVLRKILQTLAIVRFLGKAIGDEAHEIFNQKQELNYPVGKSSTISSAHYKIIDACIRLFIQFPGVLELIQTNKLNHLPITQYETDIKSWIAKKMASEFHINDINQLKEYTEYVCGRSKRIPQWISKDKKTHTGITMLKGMLNVLLPLIIQRTVSVDYGMSMQNNGEYARPYNGNTSPMEQSNIRNIFEGVTKTMMLFLSRGLDQTQVAKIVAMLKESTNNQATMAKIKSEETSFFKLFASWIPNADILSVEEKNLPEITQKLKLNPDAILFYVQHFVKQQIRFWKHNIRGGAQELEGMFASGFYDTGTPNNYGTYPAKLEMFFDKGTIGEALHIINNKCDGISFLKNNMPNEILEEVLETYFKEGSDFTALIDGSALLQGLTNDEVALAMLEHIKKHRPEIRCIVFFQKNQDGREQLVYMEKGSTKTYPFDTCKIPAEQRLSYFDQRHGFAADIPQKKNGKGLDLVGDKATLERLLQEVFRMRGIKNVKKLLREGKIDSDSKDTQTIHFAMTEDVKMKISGNRAPTPWAIGVFAWRNEIKNMAKENWDAYLKKIQAVIVRAVLDKFMKKESIEEKLNSDTNVDAISEILKNIPDINRVIELFKEFEDLLVTEVETDPIKLFGLIEQETSDIEGVLQSVKDNVYRRISQSYSFSDEEKARIHLTLQTLPKPLLPTQVKIYTDGKTVRLDLDEFEKEVAHEVENEADEEEEMNQHQEVENEQDTTSIDQTERLSKFKEWSWSNKIDPYSTEWLKMTPVREKNKNLFSVYMDEFSNPSLTPPLFNAQELIADTDLKYQALANAVDKRICFSNNFLPTIVGVFFERGIAFGELGQREMFEVLIHFKESSDKVRIKSVVCLSQHDAAEWRKLLSKNTNKKLKAILYDTKTRTIAAGSQTDLNEFLNNKDLKKLEVQLKFLNGDDYYSNELVDPLVNWLKKHNLKQLRRTLESIRKNRQKGLIVKGSIIHQGFIQARRLQKEKQIVVVDQPEQTNSLEKLIPLIIH